MIILDTTTRSLEIDLNGAVTTNQLPFVASYVDVNQSTFAVSAMATNTGASNNTTAVTLVAAPGATTSRVLKHLSIKNSDTVAALLWVQMNDNSTLREIWKGTLAVGDSLIYTDAAGWTVLNSSGQVKTGSGISSIGTSTDNALVRWDGTGGTAIQNSGWTLDDSNVLTAGGNVSLGANYISRSGTAAGLSLDASNNATLSGSLTLVTTAAGTYFRITEAGAGDGLRMLGNAAGSGARIDAVNNANSAYTPFLAGGSTVALHIGGTNKLSIDVSGNTTLSGNLTVSGVGPHAIGGATDADTSLAIRGSAGVGNQNRGMWIFQVLNPVANSDGTTCLISGTINEAGSGNHADFVSLQVNAPTIGAGAATLTNATTLKIATAPTGATNNYALWVDAGTTRLDGDATVGGTLTVSGGSVTNASGAHSSALVTDSAQSALRLFQSGVESWDIECLNATGGLDINLSGTGIIARFTSSATILSGTLTVSGASITTGSASALSLATTGGTGFKVLDQTGAVNFIEIAPGATAVAATVRAGGETNVQLNFGSKGTGSILFLTGGTIQLSLSNTAGSSQIPNGIRIGADSSNNLLDDASTGAGTATLYIGNASINVTSDERVKSDIRPIADGLSIIRALLPIEFDQDEERPWGDQRHYMGFGARHSHKVAPWAVHTQGDTGLPWKMRQEFLMAPTVRAVQQLDERLAKLEARLQ